MCDTHAEAKADVKVTLIALYTLDKMKRNSAVFPGSGKHKMLFFLLITFKMPTIVGIFTFMSSKKNYAQLS